MAHGRRATAQRVACTGYTEVPGTYVPGTSDEVHSRSRVKAGLPLELKTSR